MQRLAGIILAAGASTRLGQDKALLPCPSSPLCGAPGTLSSVEGWGQTTFLEHLLAQVKAAEVELVRVVLGANAPAVQQKISFSPAEVVINPNWQQGQLSSLLAALDSLPRGMVTGALVCLVDHPCISSRLLRRLIAEFERTTKLIILPTYRGQRGHPVLFSWRLFDELRQAPLEVGARYVVRNHPNDILEVPTREEGVILNINDEQTYRKILLRHPP